MNYSTDDITTLNGNTVAAGSSQTQRIKVQYGDDGAARDASTAFPLPTVTPNTYTTGTISAANVNLNAGTATANSSVLVTVPDGHSSWNVYISGTFSAGTLLYFQGSVDGTNWFSLNGRRNSDASTNDTTNFIASDFAGGASPTGGNPSNWRGVLGAIRFFRVTAGSYTAADSITVQIATSAGVGATFLNNIPDFRLLPGLRTTGTTTGTIFAARSATVGTSSAVLQAAPGTGLSLYITDVSVSNSGSTLSVVSFLPTAGTSFLDIVAASSGGGGSMNFQTPVKLAAATGLSVIASAASTTLYATVTGYTAA